MIIHSLTFSALDFIVSLLRMSIDALFVRLNEGYYVHVPP